MIDKQLQRMERIIRGILDLERVKSGTLSLEMCHPSRIVQNVIYELRERAPDGKITLQTEVDEALPEFACDVEQFERAIINLVENAIKFTPPGGRVSVRVHAQDDDALLFEVAGYWRWHRERFADARLRPLLSGKSKGNGTCFRLRSWA